MNENVVFGFLRLELSAGIYEPALHIGKIFYRREVMTKMKSKGFLENGSVRTDCDFFVAFLICEVFGRVQWKFQRSQITIMDVPKVKEIALTALTIMKDKPKPGIKLFC